jgi:hypothetical protein
MAEQDLVVRGETGEQSVRNREASFAIRGYRARYEHRDSAHLHAALLDDRMH